MFLKQEGETLVLLYGAARADRDMLDWLAGIVTPEGQTPGKLKELCEKAQIIAGVEIVVLEDRGSFKYYVVKVISAAKGAQGRKYLDVLSTGLSVKKGGKYILFLVNTEEHGRTMTRLVDTIKGVLDYDEALLARLAELSKGSR